MSRSLITLIAFVLCAAPIRAQEEESVVSFPEYHLSFELPFEDPDTMRRMKAPAKGPVKGTWTWRAGDPELRKDFFSDQLKKTPKSTLFFWLYAWLLQERFPKTTITLTVMDIFAGSGFIEPSSLRRREFALQQHTDPLLQPENIELVPGPLGQSSYGLYFEGDTHNKEGQVDGRKICICGVIQNGYYTLHAHIAKPHPIDADLDPLRDFIKYGVKYSGPTLDSKWTDEEILERWQKDAPDDLIEEFSKELNKKGKKKCVVRTEHYIVLTNASSGGLFYKKLEENYDAIKEVFPFDDTDEMRLLPVFLFRTKDQYVDFYVKSRGKTHEEAGRSKGHASGDYYATYYDSPKDPVHIHECTHQIFKNRLYLSGGGSWYQEGVAEYVETRPNDRNHVARIVKNGQHTPLKEFIELESLLYSSKEDVRGGGGAHDHYKQAALLIEFLRESEFGEDKFTTFIDVVGRLPRRDVPKIEAAFQEIYGCSIEELDEHWQKYCKKER